jgi:hypothetical protein
MVLEGDEGRKGNGRNGERGNGRKGEREIKVKFE